MCCFVMCAVASREPLLGKGKGDKPRSAVFFESVDPDTVCASGKRVSTVHILGSRTILPKGRFSKVGDSSWMVQQAGLGETYAA